MKLRWASQMGRSRKQCADAVRVFEVKHEELDLDYMNTWAARLNIEDLWSRLQNEAEII